MARIKQSNLVLTSSESILINGQTVINGSRQATFVSLSFDDSTSATISSISDTALSNSSTTIPTSSAVKSYVDTYSSSIPEGVDNRIVTYDGTATIQYTGVTLDASNNITGVNDLTVAGNLTASEKLVIPLNEPTSLEDGCIWIS